MNIDSVWNADKAVPFKSNEQYFCDSVRQGADYVNFRDVNPSNVEQFDKLPIFSYSRNSCWSVINHVNDGNNENLPQSMNFNLTHVSESKAISRYFHVSSNPEDSNEPQRGVWLTTNRDGYGVSENDYNNNSNQFIPVTNFHFDKMRLGVRFVIAKRTDNAYLTTINVDSVDSLLTYDSDEYVVLETHTRTYYLNRTLQWGWNTNNSLNLGVICNINNETLISANSFNRSDSDNNGLNIVPYGRWQIHKGASKWSQTDWIPRSADTGFNWIGIPFDNTADEISCVQGDVTALGNAYNAWCYRFDNSSIYAPNLSCFAGVLTIEQTIKEIAFLGLVICKFDSPTENLYVGYQNSNGETTGVLIPSSEWGTTDSLQIVTPELKDFPDIEIKPEEDDSDDDDLAQQTMSTSRQEAKFLKFYLLSDTDVDNLASDINSSLVSNPLQYLISLTEISPIIKNRLEVFAEEEQVKMGTWEASTTTGLRIKNSDGLIMVGYTQVDRVFNNFLDYDPYTKMMLYVPFCGTCEIPVDTAMGKTLSVFLNFDFENLNCMGLIYVNGALITCLSGNLGKEISTKDTNKLLKGINIGASVLSAGAIAVNGVTNNPMALFALPSAVGGIVHSLQSNCSIVKMGTGDYTDFITPTRCCLFRTMPRVEDLTGYRKSVGIRCEKFGKLKEFHGFTVCRNPHINISATEEEKEMLYELLSNGVILP